MLSYALNSIVDAKEFHVLLLYPAIFDSYFDIELRLQALYYSR